MVEGWRSIIKYLCLVYHDEREISALPQREYDALVAETLAYLEELRQSGHYVASDALEFVEAATTIRVRDRKLFITDGPFVETKEQLGGYILIEARDLNDAIRMASKFPPVRMGGIEVRPIRDHAATAQKGAEANGVEAELDFPDGLTIPARRALTGAGYVRLEQLASVSEADIAKLHGMGPKALDQIRRALTDRGLSFATDS